MEGWRDVPGSNGRYQIDISTKEGRCRSLNFKRTGKVKEFSNKPNKRNGRINWGLCINGIPRYKQAAYWIAITYPELVQNEYFEGAVIDHIDTNHLNNHPSNLRWVTSKENSNNPLTKKHMSEATMGEKNSQYGKKHSEEWKKSLSEHYKNNPLIGAKPVVQYNLKGEYVDDYPSCAEVERQTAEKYGPEKKFRQQGVARCARGERLTYKEYIWRFKEQEV